MTKLKTTQLHRELSLFVIEIKEELRMAIGMYFFVSQKLNLHI